MIARLTPQAGWPLVVGLLLVNLVLGLVPVAFVIATSLVIGAVPDAVTGGRNSPAWDRLVVSFLVASSIFVLQQVLAPVQVALGELMRRRVDGNVHERIMTTALAAVSIAPMEDQDALDALKEASRGIDGSMETPGMACAGLLALVARYTRLAGFAALVGVSVSWLAASALTGSVMVFRYGNRGGLRKYSAEWGKSLPNFRHYLYLRDLGLRPEAGKELRIFGLVGWLVDRYEGVYRTWLAPVWRARRRIYLVPYLGYTALGLAVAVLVFVLVARAGASGALSLTELALALQAIVAALLLAEYYPESDDVTQLGMLSVSALHRFARAAAAYPSAEMAATGAADPAVEDQTGVRLEAVAFSYPGSHRPVFEHLDLELEAGKCTAVVGVNGAGKTTIAKLLTRLYDPVEGRILFGDHDIRDFPLDRWRRQVSVIFQDFVKFELTVAENIALGAAHVPPDPERIRRAAARAGALEFIERLPGGFETPLSRAYVGGRDLSGGQWQRIAIARILYAADAGSRLLIFDEPTSALDVRAEAAFFDSFLDLTKGVTSLLISHRFSSVRRADTIVVIEAGQVVERGTHDELLAEGGRYERLFKLQAERFTERTESW
ncbi:ATP-binding cassette domain-containing protein [Micromonospora craniellae]|uniref:ATP-binding cassette domain-containing protein n=2 Tax=Micromonospora craniellae TaxID=2294034 RepID=A0A372FRW9_9ACTN|nr:ATP-binding cassette domain-containing protein [Micromonospora craniellae]